MRALLLVMSLIFLLSKPLFAQFNLIRIEYFSPTTNDVRARAMGRTEITSSTGSNAIFYNPANIGMLKKKTFQVGGRAYVGTINNEEYWGFLYNMDWEGKYQVKPTLSHISYATPFQPPNSEVKFVLGIGYNTYLDFGKNIITEYEDRTDSLMTTTTTNIRTTGGLRVISPSVAINFEDKYYFGATFHKSVLGKVKDGYEYDYNPAPSVPYIVKTIEEGKVSASFLSLGASGKFMAESQLIVSIIYRSGFNLKFDNLEWSDKYSDGVKMSNQHDPDNFDYKVPAYVGFGISYKVSPAIILAGEYQTRPFSDIENNDGDRLNWIDSGVCYRAGVEYLAGSVPLRLGFFSDAIFKVDYDNIGQSEEISKTLNGITGGLGFQAGNIAFDLFGEHSLWNNVNYGGPNNAKYEYEETFFTFGMMMTISIK